MNEDYFLDQFTSILLTKYNSDSLHGRSKIRFADFFIKKYFQSSKDAPRALNEIVTMVRTAIQVNESFEQIPLH